MPTPTILDIFRAAGIDPGNNALSEEQQKNIEEITSLARRDPLKLAAELVRTQHLLREVRRKSNVAAEAAAKLEAMLADLLEGNLLLCRLETLRTVPTGARAICRVNGHVRDLPIHPEVDIDELREVAPWEYVTVREQVVVGAWRNDPYLFASAQGDVVDFKAYKDREQHLVIVGHGPEEKTVMLARSLWDEQLRPHSRLVLQRDDPHCAISVVAPEHRQSRFEVPIDTIHTRLENLAGVEEIAEKLLEDILLRIFHPNIRDQYGLESLKGILLYSKPGMGKTAFMRAIAVWLHEHSEPLGFEVVLYVVKPNETKSMWHGEDARIVREELWGAIRARQSLPRTRALVQIVVLDEIDSLGKRAGSGDHVYSSAQTDALEAMLVEMDGMVQDQPGDGPPAHVLCAGMTNRPDRVDEAAKRPGRFDLVLPMPEVDCDERRVGDGGLHARSTAPLVLARRSQSGSRRVRDPQPVPQARAQAGLSRRGPALQDGHPTQRRCDGRPNSGKRPLQRRHEPREEMRCPPGAAAGRHSRRDIRRCG